MHCDGTLHAAAKAIARIRFVNLSVFIIDIYLFLRIFRLYFLNILF